MTTVHSVDVAVNYRQTVYLSEGRGKINGTDVTRMTTLPLALKGADGAEAAPVAVLAFSGTDGRLTLREHGGVLYRPVLAPGTHEPCTLESFAEAADGSRSWRDDPFRKRGAYDDVRREEQSIAAHRSDLDPSKWRKLGATSLREVTEAVRLKSAEMLVVDGIVHVACPQPVLILKTRLDPMTDKPESNLLTWALPFLDGDDHPVLGPATVKPYEEYQRKEIRQGRTPHGSRPRLAFEGETWRLFGLTAAVAAEGFAREISDRAGLSLEVADDLVTLVDPRPLGVPGEPDPGKTAREAVSGLGQGLDRRSDGYIAAWVSMRRDLNEGRIAECLDGVLAMTGLAEIAPGAPQAKVDWQAVFRGYGKTTAYLLRYAMIGRDALAARAEAEDDASLAALAPAP